MSHHSEHHFITQYISLRGTAVNEFYRMMRMGVARHVKPGLHIARRIAEHAYDDASNRILKLSTHRLKIFFVKYQNL